MTADLPDGSARSLLLLAEPDDRRWATAHLARLVEAEGGPPRVEPLADRHVADGDRLLIRTWSDRGCAAIARTVEDASGMTLLIAVGLARWIPFRWLMGCLDRAGIAPTGVRRRTVDGHLVVEFDVRRDVAPAAVIESGLELAAVAASFERAAYRPLRAAVDDLRWLPISDLPQVTDIRERWLTSPPALRMSSPRLLVSTGAQMDPRLRDVVVKDVGASGQRSIEAGIYLTSADLWPRSDPSHHGAAGDDHRGRLLALYHGGPQRGSRVAAGFHAEVLEADGAFASASNELARCRAASQLRQAIRRRHSSVALERRLMDAQPHDRVSRLRVGVSVDPGGSLEQRQRTLWSLQAQTCVPEWVTEASEVLEERLTQSWGRDPTEQADVLVAVTPGAVLAPTALEQLELAGLLWRPGATVVPDGLGWIDDRRVALREGGLPAVGPIPAKAPRPVAVAYDRRTLEMVAQRSPASRARSVLTDIADLGGIILRTSPFYAVGPGDGGPLVTASASDAMLWDEAIGIRSMDGAP